MQRKVRVGARGVWGAEPPTALHWPVKQYFLLIEFAVDGRGYPKGPVVGNVLCWYGLFEWIAKLVKNPDAKLLKKWNYRQKQFGNVNRGRDCAVKSLFTAALAFPVQDDLF